MRYIYTDSFLVSVHELIFMCGVYVAFEGNTYCWHMYGSSMVDRGFIVTCMSCLYADYCNSNNAVGQIWAMWQVYLFRGIC